MNKHLSKIKLEKICSLVFNNNYGNVIRVKGFYLSNNEWYLFNATKEEITKEKVLSVLGLKKDEIVGKHNFATEEPLFQ